MENFAVLSYVNCASVANNAMTDWEIGCQTGLAGSNRSLGDRKCIFVLIEADDKVMIGFCGHNVERVTDVQPWLDNGGRHWKYIYRVNQHILLGELKSACEKAGVDQKIFIQTKQFKFPRASYKSEIQLFFNFYKHEGVII
jgi:hypothetical protein